MINMIRILVNLSFNIWFNGVQNLDMFIDYFDSQNLVQASL